MRVFLIAILVTALATSVPVLGSVSPGAAADGPPRYAITELAALEQYHGLQEFDINNDGAVLANDLSFDTFTPTVHVYQAGRKARELKGGSGGARGFGINDRGEVVGVVYDSDPDTGAQLTQAVLWRDGKMTRLLAPENISFAWDINNAGDIIGRSQSSQDDPHPEYLIWRTVVPDVLDFQPTDINNTGQLVGYIKVAINGEPLHPHAVLWNQGVVTDLGTLGGDESFATGISDSGRIVGVSSTEPGPAVGTSGTRAFTWFQGKLTSLPPLEEGNELELDWTSHINKDGIAVGYSTVVSRDVPLASSTAVMWHDGKIFDLNNLIPGATDLFLIEGAAINDNGEIAAVALDGDGHAHLLLLTPADEDAES